MMKYIESFESYLEPNSYLIKNRNFKYDSIRPKDLLKFIGLDTEKYYNGDEVLDNPYNINIIDYLKEIFLNKRISFKCLESNGRWLDGIAKDVKLYLYKEIYINLKIDDRWFTMHNNYICTIIDYDADSKPIHKELEIKKDGDLFNL